MKKTKQPGGVLGRNIKHAEKIKSIIMIAVFIIAFLAIGAATDSLSTAFTGSTLSMAAFIPAVIPADETAEQKAKREELDFINLMKHNTDEIVEAKMKVANEKIAAMQKQLETALAKEGLTAEQKTEIASMATKLKAIEEKAPSTYMNLVQSIKKAVLDNQSKLQELKEKKIRSLSIEIKAQQDPTDIGQRTDYADFLPGTNMKPVRDTFMRNLFRTIPVSKEYIKYREENVVTRDAKVVIACATSTHNTKKTWVNRTVQIQKVRDFVDICLDMIDDYDFVEAEIRQLTETAVKLKTDAEIFNGTGDILSIDSIASEFDAANVLAPYDGTAGTGFKDATLAELTAAMKAQIYTFGAEKKWNADTIIMNHNDWTRFMHLKNANGDYLLPNFVLTNGGFLNGMQVVTNPLVEPNTLYVLDSRQGAILDRKQLTVEFSYENNDNFEHEIVTVKAIERVQFLVKEIDKDAFMKCSDIAAALTAIENV